ncbi:MAG: phytanoyl-CoA dioxygenase family protein [Deltaproteobacteria bacterium]|nr:phytanoyl-CoA dioxygenase family protein [Deltaproteobacteria bacterium]
MSVDFRTRLDADQAPVETGLFFREALPACLDAHQALIAPGGSQLRLRDLCIEVDGEPWTLSWQGDRATVGPGSHGQARVRLTGEQLTDIVNDQITPVALMSNAILDMPEGGLPDFLDWWLILRSVLDGRRVHAAGDVEFATEPRHSFSPDDSDEDMRRFLEEVGYLHIRGLFDGAEMAAVEADYTKAASHYEKGDDQAWFATTHDGEEHLVRMEGFDRYSQISADLIEEDRFLRIGRITGCGHKLAAQPGQRIGALIKPIGIVQGISDVPWHKDCSLGRHSYECCSLTVGISVTGAGAESGQLRVVPGSHRALVWPAPCIQPGLDLQPIDLPTRTGDVTVHLSCTQHMSQAPVDRTRKVIYTSFNQVSPDAEKAAANRARLGAVRSKTHTSVSQFPGHLGD